VHVADRGLARREEADQEAGEALLVLGDAAGRVEVASLGHRHVEPQAVEQVHPCSRGWSAEC
jgi:hypothetical protein